MLTQACLFLTLSALGVADLLTASPIAFTIAKMIGAAFLIWTRVRSWRRTAMPPKADNESIYGRAFLIGTINPKSVAGYFAAFTQFVQPDVPIMAQMWIIVPTALCLTAASY
jgi:homoserine/homoserine lactone efflux protein